MSTSSWPSRRRFLRDSAGVAGCLVPAVQGARAATVLPSREAGQSLVKQVAAAPMPSGWREVWSDSFTTLSLRSGGPSFAGLTSGTGAWSAAAPWYGHDNPKGWEGYGNDWFVDPSYLGWPASYPKLGQFTITPEGLRIRAQEAPPDMAALLPAMVKGAPPWLSGQVSSFLGVRIRPPFYFEARARMPPGRGRPWPAIWLCTNSREPYPNDKGMEYEIDVHEGFADSTKLHSTLHWTIAPDKPDYPSQVVTDETVDVDLSNGFNTWGCKLLPDSATFYFNGRQVGAARKPQLAYADQPFGVILDVSAGIPWEGPPSGGPQDMTVRYVKLYAPDAGTLTLNGVWRP